MKECKIMKVMYNDGELKHSYFWKNFKSKKEGIEYLKDFRNNMKKHVSEEFGEEVLDWWVEKSNKYEFIYVLRCTDYGTGYIDFRYEYKIV